jgi:hypothetical protein
LLIAAVPKPHSWERGSTTPRTCSRASVQVNCSDARGSNVAGLIQINEAMTPGATLPWQVAALWRNLFQRSSREYAFSATSEGQ